MPDDQHGAIAVLISGGVESAVLCGELLRSHARVYPIYVRCGLAWEPAESASARRFLQAIAVERLAPLVVLDEPIGDVYGPHWSTGAEPAPGADTPDEAVYLPGRNLLLTVKSAVWCRLRGVPELALGSLGSNPFPDATPEFFRALEGIIRRAMSGGPRLVRPFGDRHKSDVVALGDRLGLPLHLTFSCIRPVDGRHCGVCNKCDERRRGFREVGLEDRTPYAGSDLDPSR